MTLSEVQALMERYDALDMLRAEVEARHAAMRKCPLADISGAAVRWLSAHNRLTVEELAVRGAIRDALQAEAARA